MAQTVPLRDSIRSRFGHIPRIRMTKYSTRTQSWTLRWSSSSFPITLETMCKNYKISWYMIFSSFCFSMCFYSERWHWSFSLTNNFINSDLQAFTVGILVCEADDLGSADEYLVQENMIRWQPHSTGQTPARRTTEIDTQVTLLFWWRHPVRLLAPATSSTSVIIDDVLIQYRSKSHHRYCDPDLSNYWVTDRTLIPIYWLLCC